MMETVMFGFWFGIGFQAAIVAMVAGAALIVLILYIIGQF